MRKPQVANLAQAYVLDQLTAGGELWQREGDKVRCVACGHRCLIGEGGRGICKVRFVRGGELLVPWGYVAGLQCDPVEKKPFFHVYPSSDALTFGMLGCDLHCSYCQNWLTSQALRDSSANAPARTVTPAQLVDAARREGARLVVSSYNEPLITAEWAVAVFREATAAGLICAFVSNGNATPEVLDYLRPWIRAYKVDLKSFDDRHYRTLGCPLDSVLNTIRMVHERGLWLEVVTLVIPGFNDSEDELRAAARFLASVSRDIPWHVTAFHKDYKMTDPAETDARQLIRACEIGTEEGLRFVYAGNLPGRVGQWENTRCPGCAATLIERYGYLVRSYRITEEGRCPDCRTPIPGVWPGAAAEVRTGDLSMYRQRLPRAVRSPAPKEESPMTAVPMTRPVFAPVHPERLDLTPDQHRQIHGVAAQMLRGVVDRAEAVALTDDLGGCLVSGSFVSLKRGKHLRSCCGGLLDRPAPLRDTLADAVARTALEDVRFPPVSPAELPYLDLEVWLLFNPQPIRARGEERVGAVVTGGKHGLLVRSGPNRGILLPGVAVDHDWDARTFLEQVCTKAGVHPSRWKDDDTALLTFEGASVRGPVVDGEDPASPPPPFLSRAQLAAYVEFCRENLLALVVGAAARYSLPGAPDGNVSGVVLTVDISRLIPGEPLQVSHISLRPTVALQGTLFQLTQLMARALAARGISGLDNVPIGLTVLYDPAMHGTAAEPDLRGVDPRRRAILVLERGRSGLAHDPGRTAEELLAEAKALGEVSDPAAAPVFSLEADTSAERVALSTAPRPMAGPAVRPPAQAGTFYPGDAAGLFRTVDELLGSERGEETWPAAMVPHAGLRFSGRIAAGVLRRLAIPRTVIVLGPKHTALGMEWAVAPHAQWALPGATLAADPDLARELAQAIPGLALDAAAHQQEHAIEVELPFLARLAPQSRVVGIAIGHADLDGCRRFAEGLAAVLERREERPLLLISSDMNHFATDAENRRLDELALAALERLDPEDVYQTVRRHHVSMCGVLPAVIVLETLRRLGGLRRAERVGYATTADVTGDPSRVVGYAGMLFG